MTAVPALPYLFKSKEHARRILDGPIGDEILASLEAVGLIGLCFYDAGPRNLYSISKPIRTPADMYGLRVRVQQGDVWADMFRAIGANPVAVPTDRVYLNLKSRLIDAADHSWPSYVSQRHYDVAPYFNVTEHSMAPAVLVFSKLVWDSLSASDQAIIRSAAKDSVPHMRRLWDEQEAAGRSTVEGAGGTIVTDVDRKAFADRLTPLYSTVVDNDKLLSMARRIRTDEPLEQSGR
jgi:TRAP-type C4-dicarboxylate transport system substrate-binding protein